MFLFSLFSKASKNSSYQNFASTSATSLEDLAPQLFQYLDAMWKRHNPQRLNRHQPAQTIAKTITETITETIAGRFDKPSEHSYGDQRNVYIFKKS